MARVFRAYRANVARRFLAVAMSLVLVVSMAPMAPAHAEELFVQGDEEAVASPDAQVVPDATTPEYQQDAVIAGEDSGTEVPITTDDDAAAMGEGDDQWQPGASVVAEDPFFVYSEDEMAAMQEEASEEEASEEGEEEADEEERDELISVADAEAVTGIDASQEGSAYAAGEVLVTFADGTQVNVVAQVTEEAQSVEACGFSAQELVATDVQGAFLQGEGVIEPTVVAEVAEEATVVQAVAELQADPAVVDAQPNYLYYSLDDGSEYVTDDDAWNATGEDGAVEAASEGIADEAAGEEGLMAQSTAVNDPGDSNNQAAWEAVGLYKAWELMRCDHAASVAIIDTGFDAWHEDIASNVVATWDVINNTSDVGIEQGGSNHGTHVAGIVAATANNGIGMAGTSYNAGLVLVKAYDGSSGGDFTTSGLVKAYTWITNNSSARVVNMSIGGYYSGSWQDSSLLKAIDAAYNSGILTVCAAGNAPISDSKGNVYQAPYPCYPGDYDACLSVMSLKGPEYESLYSSSNYNVSGVSEGSVNATKDLCAPGSSLYSTILGGYGTMSGTSMSAPMVSGIAALCFAANPGLSPGEVMSILESTATDLGPAGWDGMFGYGRVNAYAALAYILGVDITQDDTPVIEPEPDPEPEPEPEPSEPTGVPALKTTCSSHVQSIGWQDAVTSTEKKIATSGTSGKSLRLEAVRIRLEDPEGKKLSGAITYRTHVQSIGWQNWVSDGALAGTNGRALRLEAIQIKLKGDYAKKYDVYYRVHAQSVGWLDWACNGEQSGTAGYSYRLEALQVVVVEKGAYPSSTSPGSATLSHFQSLRYTTHVQRVGWQSWRTEGKMAGTSGRSLRLEGIKISLGRSEYSGDILYRTHVQRIGWQGWRKNGAMSGTHGRSLRLEGIEIKLTGEMAKHYDVYYRVHVQSYGWQDWKSNGQTAGTVGKSKRLEAIEIKLVPKG